MSNSGLEIQLDIIFLSNSSFPIVGSSFLMSHSNDINSFSPWRNMINNLIRKVPAEFNSKKGVFDVLFPNVREMFDVGYCFTYIFSEIIGKI